MTKQLAELIAELARELQPWYSDNEATFKSIAERAEALAKTLPDEPEKP